VKHLSAILMRHTFLQGLVKTAKRDTDYLI